MEEPRREAELAAGAPRRAGVEPDRAAGEPRHAGREPRHAAGREPRRAGAEPRRTGSVIALGVLLLYGLFLVALSIDIIVRVWDWRFRFETPVDVVVLLYFESMRSLVTLTGLAVAGIAAYRARRHPALLHLSLAVVFATLAYTKAMAFESFPGAMQQALATSLRGAGVPDWLLLVVFGYPQWAFWLTLPPLLLFAARYPRPLTRADIAGTGAGERSGTMRSVAVAGTDVGSVARRATVRLLEGGGLHGRLLWALAFAGAAVHTAAVHLNVAVTVVSVAAGLAFVAAAAVLITLFRAATRVADSATRPPLDWLRRGAAAGLALFVVAALVGFLLPGGIISTGAMSLAPAVMAACALAGVLLLGSAPATPASNDGPVPGGSSVPVDSPVPGASSSSGGGQVPNARPATNGEPASDGTPPSAQRLDAQPEAG